ncbi:MAG: hypothetical protein CMM08_09715 [Rhodospirillaceae bacterium]|jgi:DNA-binding transcriptional LysR family regulator|nr:hypothetical protein [Rhodospirillaceae bacterium]
MLYMPLHARFAVDFDRDADGYEFLRLPRQGITDMAFLLTNTFQASDLQIEAVGHEPLVVVAHPDHPLTRRKAVQVTDFAGENVLLSRSDCSYRRGFERILDESKVEPGSILEFNSVATLKECVCAGVGISILPEVAAREETQRGRLAVLRWRDQGLRCKTLMIWHQDKWLSPALEAFMTISRDVLGNFDKAA